MSIFPYLSHAKLPKIPLRWVLVIPFVAQTVGVVTLVGFLSYRSGQQAVEKLAYHLMENVGQQVTQELDRYLQQAYDFNQRQRAAVESGMLDLQNLDQLHHYLILQHRQSPDLTSLLFGTPKGDFRVSHRISPSDLGVTTRLQADELPFEASLATPANPSQLRVYSTNAAGDRVRLLTTVNLDLRNRPWYRQAIKTGQPGWTEPFQVGSTNLLALNAYAPIYSQNRQLLGVSAVNISLNRLGDFLQHLEVSQSGEIFIIDQQGLLIANSTQEAAYDVKGKPDLGATAAPEAVSFQRRTPDALSNLAIRQSYDYLRANVDDLANLESPRTFNFSAQGHRYFLTAAPFHESHGLNWLVVTVVPESDFMAEIQTNLRRTLLLCLVALGLTLASGLVIAHYVTARIRRLNQASQQLATGDLSHRLPLNSPVSEVQGLSQAFNQMAEQLRQLFQSQVETEATRRSEARFQQLAAAVPGMIYTYVQRPDGSHGFEYVSSMSQDILELQPEEIIANAEVALEQVHPEDRSTRDAALVYSATTLAPFTLTFRNIAPSGQLKWLEANSRPLRQSDGTIAWYGILLDVSERAQLEADRRATETALRQSELKFSTLFRHSPQPAWIATLAEGRCLDINESFSRVLGFSRAEAVGKTCVELGLWQDLQDLQQFRTSLLQTGRLLDLEAMLYTKSGETKTVLLSAAVSRLAGQDCVLGVLNDISDRKQIELQLRRTEQWLQQFSRQSPSSIYTLVQDPDGHVWFEYTSSAVEAIHEVTQEQALENAALVMEQMHPDDRTGYGAAAARSAERLERFSYEWRVITPSGQLKWLQAKSQPERRSNGSIAWHGVVQDITDRKQVEQELQQAKAAAETANKAKSLFLANMSHELRTPLNSILGFSQLMQRYSNLHADEQVYLKAIHTSGNYLLKLINQILDLSKIEAGRFTLDHQAIDLFKQLRLISSMLSERIHSQGLQFQLELLPDVPQYITADVQKLEQVLLNLLSNAIKFTKAGQITLRVQVSQQQVAEAPAQQPVTLLFEVEDTGIGIAPEDLDLIFEAFAQTGVGQQAQEGTGLGLTISRRLVQLMGGEITVYSLVGQGSRFRFTLPVATASPAELQPSQRHQPVVGLAAHQPAYRILVVEDQPESRLLLVKLLQRIGLAVREASAGAEALAQWQQWRPHLILLDVQLPGLNGYEVTRQIRAAEQNAQHTVILALTAQALPRDRQLALAAGCDDYVSKPFQEEILFQKMADHLGIEYVYGEVDPDESSSAALGTRPSPADLAVMSDDWIAQLYQNSRSCEDKALMQLIQQIPPESADLARCLKNWVQDYQFQQMIDLVKSYLDSQLRPNPD